MADEQPTIDGPVPFVEFDAVRVVRLRRPAREWGIPPEWRAAESHWRAPEVGDRGVVVHAYRPNDPRAPVVVECAREDGRADWIAEFDPDELELIEAAPRRT
jgi:hypothetical protein